MSKADWASAGRVSTEEQYEEGVSYETQRKLNQDLIKKNKGKLYKEYLEHDVSAYKKRIIQRPVMMELLEDVAKGHIKNIVAFKRDRLVRDPEDYYYIRKIFDKAGVKVYFTAPGELPWEQATPAEVLMNGMMPLLAKFESMTTAQRVRANVLEAVKRGEWRCGTPPYGYRYNTQNKMVEQVPHQVEVVRLIRDKYIKGLGAGKIADVLNNELKIPYESPVIWRKPETQKKPRNFWYEGVVTSIVAKPVYMGIQEWGGQWYKCSAIDPIFTEEEWAEANKIYLGKLNKKIPHKYFNNTFLFKGVLFCSHCGEKMAPSQKTSRYVKEDNTTSIYEYYHYKCEGRWQKFNGCKQKKHNRSYIEAAIIYTITERIENMNIDELYNMVLEKSQEDVRLYKNQIIKCKESLKELENSIDRNIEAYQNATSEIIRKHLEKKAEQYEQQRDKVEQEFINLENNPPNMILERDDVLNSYEAMQSWKGIMENPTISRETKRKLVVTVVEKVEVDKDCNLKIKYKLEPDCLIKNTRIGKEA